jgi:hypothetical protein
MSEIDHFKIFVMCSGDATADVDHLHVKKIHLEPLVGHLYIVREDKLLIKTVLFSLLSPILLLLRVTLKF